MRQEVSGNSSLGKFINMEAVLADIEKKQGGSERPVGLKNSDSLGFLKEDNKIENIFDKEFWSLYEGEKALKPLEFSNGKSQEDVVEEIVGLVKEGKKVIFLHGMCGTGKSAIALNIARVLGKAAIVVPVKSLQRQYEEEYMGKKYVIKPDGRKMKIAMITGRENHDSLIFPGKSCADPFLPDTIKITEKNVRNLREFYKDNPYINNNVMPPVKGLKRISVAPANPYWSPILPAEIELKHFTDADKKMYEGMHGKKFIFYHRRRGCSYYDQYLSYFDSDVIIFNSAKYLSEVSFGRKPKTEVDIIDEADEFLDKLSNSFDLNLTRLGSALKSLVPESREARETLKEILELIDLEERNKKALGVDEAEVSKIGETKIEKVLKLLSGNAELEVEIELDEMNYANQALEAAREFRESFDDTYLTYRKDEDFLFATLVTTDLSKKFGEIVRGNRALILMSGTLHSKEVLKHIFGIEDFASVDAEVLGQGAIEIFRTGKEFDCKYTNLQTKRSDYLNALSLAVEKAERPVLVHVNAFKDLPNREEEDYPSLVVGSDLRDRQWEDKTGKEVSNFKRGDFDVLFTTKCSRGIDFPGDICKSVVFTKYPNPNVRSTFWTILKKTHPDFYWEFYRDKARREFLQRIYRALRSKDDHVYVLSPDSRVLEAVRGLQESGDKF